MTRKQKNGLIRIGAGVLSYVAVILYTNYGWFPEGAKEGMCFFLFLIPYLITGFDVVKEAVRNIFHGEIFDENFLMSIATIGAFVIHEYKEAVAVMLFYQVGEWFQSYAVTRSRKSISELMDIRPDYANIEVEGKLTQVDPEQVGVGDIIIVKPGERIPIDGIVVEGESFLDTSALTGESVPRKVEKNTDVISGCINTSGRLSIKTTKAFTDSTVSKILDLVENASSKKAKTENFITRFARYYTPVVVIGALLLAMIPPIITGQPFSEWLSRALIFLVISCPCALVISVPLGFFGGIGGASKCGILIKGSNYLEVLANVDTVVFDKTGTLTKGTFRVTKCYPQNHSQKELLELAALAEQYSNHPISLSIRQEVKETLDASRIADTKEIAGHGICAVIDGREVLAGNDKLMQKYGISSQPVIAPGTIVYIAADKEYYGAIVIADEVKEDAKEAVLALRNAGVEKTVMLTGDSRQVAEYVAKNLGIDVYHSELLPQDKVERLEQLLKEQKIKRNLAFVGDGINDAPVLSRADLGIAMGGMGSDAAIEAADVVLMDDKPAKIALAVRIARKTLKIVKQNIIFALAIKVIVLILGACGIATMWYAVFADVGVSVIAILNSMRSLSVKNI